MNEKNRQAGRPRATSTFLANTPEPPYYAVIFSNVRTEQDPRGYAAMADQMVELAFRQPGFLGVESVRDVEGQGITVSYWESEEAIQAWKADTAHQVAQAKGKADWYADYRLRVALVQRENPR